MRRFLAAFGFLVLAVPAFAQRLVDSDGRVIQVFPYKDHPATLSAPAPEARNNNLTNHGGPTITQAHVVEIFWGPSWGNGQTPGAVASELMAFYSQFGTTPEYKTIVQYSGIQQNNLTNVYWIDGVNPSNVAVTDAMIQNADRQITLQTQRAVQEIRREAVDLSLQIASKIIQRNLSKEDNDLLTRVGPGTTMGEMMRRYWIPPSF